MLQWTSKPSDGNRSLFKYPYQVAIKQQLRVIIRNGIAVGEEQLYMHPENLRNGDATLYEITGKRDGWKRRDQLGFAFIFLSIMKLAWTKIMSLSLIVKKKAYPFSICAISATVKFPPYVFFTSSYVSLRWLILAIICVITAKVSNCRKAYELLGNMCCRILTVAELVHVDNF